ncbi:YibE/F family protein, partial [Listeria monocytogenes]|nr:YibE/F family protein [Listeria monocytogenes]
NGWLLSQALPMHLSLEIVRTVCGGFALVLSVPLTLLCFEVHRRKAK